MSEPGASPALAAHPVGQAGGHGPVVVFVHGIEDGWPSWRRLAGYLDPDYRCVALDMPWRAGNDYRWRAQGSPGGWLARALRDLDQPADVLVGHSFGAGALLELLAAGVTARAATLIAPAFRPPDLEVTWRVFDRSRSAYEIQIRQGLELSLGPRAPSLDPGLRAAITDKAFDRIGPASFLAVFEQFAASGDLALGAVTVPTLVLSGCRDASLSPSGARALAERMPGATVTRAEDFDHFCHLRRAADVAARLAGFIGAACPPEGRTP